MIKTTLPKISEHAHQVNLFSWAAMAKVKHPELALLYAVPNGGLRHKAVAGKLKAEGVKSGVPDVVLSVAKKGFNSLFIEMKTKGGKLNDNQKIWIENLNKFGNKAVVCWSFDEARQVIEEYLS